MDVQEQRATFTPFNTGTMVDTIPSQAHLPGMAAEIRNLEFLGEWRRRRGWARLLPDDRMPCETIIGYHCYRDTQDRLHRVAVAEDSEIYHFLGETPTEYTVVRLFQDVFWQWDRTYRATFAARQDDLFIAFWQPPEELIVPPARAQNLRLAGLSDVGDPQGRFSAYGVSVPAPATAPTLTAVVGGNLGFNAYNYMITFKDATTGWESDASPIASLTLVQPDAPDRPIATDSAVGLLDAGTYEYATCFLNATTGVRSPLSLPRQITLAALRQVALTNVRICPDAGNWHREIYRRRAGGPWNRHITIANNTTQNAADNTQADSGVVYDVGAQGIRLSDIPVYAGGGAVANGRTIYRCIYRATGDGTYSRLTGGVAEILNNTAGGTYTDINAQTAGDPWQQALPVPLCGIVCAGPDNTILWLNNKVEARPALAYPVVSPDMPEALRSEDGVATPLNVGTDDDPITACAEAADGWIVSKRKSYHFVTRECTSCTRIIKGHGNVSPHTLTVLDGLVVGLSADGPGYIDYKSSRTWRYIGGSPERFDLGTTWDRVVKPRLPYSAAFHWPRCSMIGWAVQACSLWPAAEEHSDLCIVWDYSVPDGGKVWLMDWTGIDTFGQVPQLGGATDSVEAAFAFGVIGKMFDGEHGDGTVGVLSGTVIAVDNNLVDVATADLGGQDVVGSVLFINGGAGDRRCRTVEVCESVWSLIVATGYSRVEGGRTTLHLKGTLGIAAGSEFEIGGWLDRGAYMLNVGLPMSQKEWMTIHCVTH